MLSVGTGLEPIASFMLQYPFREKHTAMCFRSPTGMENCWIISPNPSPASGWNGKLKNNPYAGSCCGGDWVQSVPVGNGVQNAIYMVKYDMNRILNAVSYWDRL